MAVAMTASSLPRKPSSVASRRPSCRAARTSVSAAMETRISSMDARLVGHCVQMGQTSLQVERGVDALEVQTELDHRKRDVRLDADDDGLGTSQLAHEGKGAECPSGE